MVLPLFGAEGPFQPRPAELPEALLEEQAALQHIADLVHEEASPSAATGFDEPPDLVEEAIQPLTEHESTAIREDWLSAEPEAGRSSLADPVTTSDHGAELTDGHGELADRAEHLVPEQTPLPPAEIPATEPASPSTGWSKLLSWLDNRFHRREIVGPEPQELESLAPVDVAAAVEPSDNRQAEPEDLAPEPPASPVAPPGSVEEPVAVDVPGSRKIGFRRPKRAHLPSLFAPSEDVAAVDRVDDPPAAPRGRFGRRVQQPPATAPIDGPDLAAGVPVAADLPASMDPTPTSDIAASAVMAEPLRHEPAELVGQEPEPAPSQPAAYWARSDWTPPAQPQSAQPENLAWTPPPGNPAGVGGRRTTPAMDGLWEAEPDGAVDSASAAPDGTGRSRIGRIAALGMGVVVLAVASVAIFRLLPRAFTFTQVPVATFNAPMMVLRASGPGRVASIAVQNGQTVDPTTVLLTIRTEPQSDPAAALLRARLEATQARLSELDQAIAQMTPTTDAGRTRIAELRQQRASAVIDVAQLQDGVANIPATRSSDVPVKAGVHGVIRSLEARAGTATTAGLPLVRMLDCDHAFLTVGPESKLHAGEAVQVRLPNLQPIAATVRQSAGIAEPPDSLVIATQPGAFVEQLSGACPIGATATVTPSMTGS